MLIDLHALYRPSLEFILKGSAVNIDYLCILTCVLECYDMLLAGDDVLVISTDLLNVVSSERQLLSESYGHVLAHACVVHKTVLRNRRTVFSYKRLICIQTEYYVLSVRIAAYAIGIVVLHEFCKMN